METGVTVLAGPASSGKTERLLAEYRSQLRRREPGSALWIASTWRGAAEIRGRLLGPDLEACFSPAVMTFDRFAESVLEASGSSAVCLSRFRQRQLLRQLIGRASARGELRFFGPIAETRGLVDLALALVRELKRLEIWPDEFAQACRQRGASGKASEKDQELAALYTAYQEVLNNFDLYDVQGRFWSARAMLHQGKSAGLERLRLVVVDGFTDFTRPQHEILASLAERAERLLISLPWEAEPRRGDLFAKTVQTLKRLRSHHPRVRIDEHEPAASATWTTLAHLERYVFRGPHELRPIDAVDGVEILAAAGRRGEIEQIGRRIKILLHDGNATPQDIAVVFRSLREIAPTVREVFAELGIPAAVAASEPLSNVPALRAVAALVRLRAEDWPFTQLLAALSSNYLQPNWPEWCDGAAVVAADGLVRKLQVPRGREALIAQVERIAANASVTGETVVDDEAAPSDSETSTSLRHQGAATAAPLLRRLAAALDRLPERASLREWSAALEVLADDIGLLRVFQTDNPSQLDQFDGTGCERLKQILHEADLPPDWLGEAHLPTWTLSDFAALLRDILRHEEVPQSLDESGRVRVLDAIGARTLRVPYLFLAGLSEKSFPPTEREDRMYGEAELAEFKGIGLPMVDRAERSSEEMLLFYEVLTRASRQLVLSYPAMDESGEELTPSPFLRDVQRACGEDRLKPRAVQDLSPIPSIASPQSDTDLRVLAVHDGLQGDQQLLAGMLHDPSRKTTADNLMANLVCVHHRQHGESFGPFEGVLTSDAVRRDLAQRFGPDHLWSPSQLEQYASCPYQFYLQRVLGLEPLPELGLEVDHLLRGRLVHETLARVHRQFQSMGRDLAELQGDGAAFAELFRNTVRDIADETHRGGKLQAALLNIYRDEVAALAERYVKQLQGYLSASGLDAPPIPTHFEVRFGPPRRPDDQENEQEDPLSSDDPFELEIGQETIKIVGRIDRVDLARVGERSIFSIFDYKSGRPVLIKSEQVEAGVTLQLLLYAMAAEKLLAEHGAVPWQVGYWAVQQKSVLGGKQSLSLYQSAGGELTPTDDWQDLYPKLRTRVGRMIEWIRSGAFPMHSYHDDCTSRCDFKTVCRVGQIRSLEKAWPPPEETP